jgi:hypothetical protein
MNNPLSLLLILAAVIGSGYLSWQIVELESFIGALIFLAVWAVLSAIVRFIVAIVVIKSSE